MPCVLPEPRLLDATVDNSPTDISKMTQLKQYAKDGRMRKNLLQMDMLAFWYQQGWACPSNVYQWVAEMVAFESEYMVAKHARDTLFSLWTTLPGEKMPFKAGSACNGCITMDTIKHVFEAYGLDTSSSSVRLLAKNSELMRMHSTNKAADVPVTQLGWFMQLISKSMTLWPQAYSEEDVAYMVRVLVSFGADAMSILALSDLQDALHASLYVLSTDRWMPFARNVSEELGNAYNWELDVIAPMVTTISPWLPRCLYLRRIFAILALAHSMSSNRANGYLSDVQIASATAAATTPDPRIATVASAVASGAILTPDSIPCSPAILSAYSTPTNATPRDTPTPPIVPVVPETVQIVVPTPSASTFDASTTQQQSNNSAEIEDNGYAAAVESKSTTIVSQDTPALGESTIVRLITVVDQFLAFKLDKIDFHRLIQQITLLDSAISGNMDEIQQIKEEIQHLVSRLKMLGRKLSSASLGSLERTMAGEVVQRLWNRLNYLVHRNGSKLQKDEL
ncbi:hypothetical protein BC940DRAFT_159132 [Gongronella butleri]|nr:hypothetical protein BC940DRAFT_159132 [Gongronella butleri]